MSGHENKLCFTPASTLAKQIKRKQLSPVEVTEAFLNRIESINPHINAFCTLLPENALDRAKQAEAAVIRGDATGPLHGVPIGIKDLSSTAGIRTTFGSRLFENHIPDRDTVYVKRIRNAGAIIIGKTNTPEFGHKGTTDNLVFGTTKNPWNHNMTAGGSSGGSAAAVAAGLVPFAEGSDGGGSIRIPASACGIFGFKPSYGRVPYDAKPSNVFSAQNPFFHIGPLSRTVEDAALLFSVMAGPHPVDPFCLPDTGDNYKTDMLGDVKGWKIAFSPHFGIYEVDAHVQATISQAANNLQTLGCEVDLVEPDFGQPKEVMQKAFAILWCTQLAAAYGSYVEKQASLFSPDVLTMIQFGQAVRAVDYKQTEVVRTAVWMGLQQVFEKYDLLITPTLAVPPFSHTVKGPTEINGKRVNPQTDWAMTSLINLTGHPAASIPAGFAPGNLPIGMQVIGRRFADSSVLRFSHCFEEAYPWAQFTPNIESGTLEV